MLNHRGAIITLGICADVSHDVTIRKLDGNVCYEVRHCFACFFLQKMVSTFTNKAIFPFLPTTVESSCFPSVKIK